MQRQKQLSLSLPTGFHEVNLIWIFNSNQGGEVQASILSVAMFTPNYLFLSLVI